MLTIGIDMSKCTFHAALDDTTVRKFKNSLEGIDFFHKEIKTHFIPTDTTIGIESTGVYHLLLAVCMRKIGYIVKIINPLESHRFLVAQTLRRTKTDAVDALAIRKMLPNAGYIFTDTDDTLALKTLATERAGLVQIQTMLKQRRESRSIRTQALNREVYDSSTLLLKSIAAEIKRIEKEMATFAPETQKLLQTIPGVGKVSSMLLVAHIGDITRFDTPEKLVAYIGLDPRVHQSGTSVHGKGYISKRGNNQLRTTLFQAAFMARQKNPQFKKYFDKKIGEGKHYTSALVAIERKLVHLIFAVWTRGTPYEERTVTE